MAYWNDSVTENPKPVSMMVRLMFTPIILRSIPRKTVTGISMTIIIRTIRGTDQKYMVWREETGIPGKINCWKRSDRNVRSFFDVFSEKYPTDSLYIIENERRQGDATDSRGIRRSGYDIYIWKPEYAGWARVGFTDGIPTVGAAYVLLMREDEIFWGKIGWLMHENEPIRVYYNARIASAILT